MSIAGVSGEASKNFTNVTGNATLRAKFVKNVVDTVEMYNFDGVDIDWESTSEYKVVPENMNNLAKDLRAELNKRQVKGGTPYLLTAAIPASSWGAGSDRFDFKTLNNYLDYINMMSYDLNNPDKSTHLSALYSSNYDKGFGFSVQYGINLYTSRGFDKSKIIIGTAGYGKAYKVSNPNLNAKYPGLGLNATLTQIKGVDGSFASGTVFLNVIDVLLATGKYKKYIEYNSNNQIVGSYLFNESENIFVSYETEEVMRAKYQYATSVEGMGIMCWAYTEDTSDTYVNTIYDQLKK
jgi:chitinase